MDIPLFLDPVAIFKPTPGRMIVFPSFIYHETIPSDEGDRLWVAIDIV